MNRNNLLGALSDNIRIDTAKCLFCGECVERCVLDNLRMRLSPCRGACPLGLNIQGYVQLIARGREDEARAMIARDLPFPGILGRVCSAPCERLCHRTRETGQPVSIRALKRYLFDKTPFSPPQPAPDTGKRVAVVGAGPAGLLAACDLALAGHQVTVFEAEDAPGGLMRGVIPAFRLPLDIVERESAALRHLGVSFRFNSRLGRDITLQKLEESFDAVILAVGLGEDRSLGIEGEDLAGVYHGLDILRAAKRGEGPRLFGHVVVIGGGNSAVDAAQIALRLGADSARLLSLEEECALPAFAEEVSLARDMGVRFTCGWGALRIHGKDGKVASISAQRCTGVLDKDGRFAPTFDTCVLHEIEADAVIIAIGQRGDALAQAANIDPRTADPLTAGTGRPKVFLAGDCRGRPGSIVEAMASGRRAAESALRLLRGEDLRYGRAYAGPYVFDFAIETDKAPQRDRIHPPARACAGAGDFGELESAYGPAQARAEAERCYSCGRPEGHFRNCWFCLPCEVSCPAEALWVEIPYLVR